MNRLRPGLLLLALCGKSLVAQPVVQEAPQVAVVKSLYERFAAEAVLDVPSVRSRLIDQPLSVLSHYFDHELARLWLRDRACAQRRREVCSLDFSPIWDSQDPAGATVSLQPTADKNVVQAVVNYPGAGKKFIRYRLTLSRKGWRIHDIDFDGRNESLRAILGGSSR